MIRKSALSTLLTTFSVVLVFAQVKPEFGVTSVKANRSGDSFWNGTPLTAGVGHYTARNATLKNLLGSFFGVDESRVLGGPAWMDSEKYDVEGKVDGQPSREDLIAMIQSLVENRFQLKYHRETRELPRYTMGVAKKGLKFGPHLVRVDDRVCSPGDSSAAGCRGLRFSPGTLASERTTFSMLANTLGAMLGRPVIDQTGLSGRFDLNLELTTDKPADGQPALRDASGQSVIAALREQIGLEIEATKGPGEVIVIDSASKPTDN